MVHRAVRLVVAIAPGSADPDHAMFADVHPLIERWMVDNDLASSIHPPGVLDPASDGFPGKELAALGWDRITGTCATAWCHGAARPVWATTGAIPPATPAHTPGLPLTACARCHPNTVDAAGNIVNVDGPGGPTSDPLDGEIDAP